jgi:plastocyanin
MINDSKIVIVLVLALVAASCSRETAHTGAGAAKVDATASGTALVTGKAPAPSAVIVLKSQSEQTDPPQNALAQMDQSGQAFVPEILMVRTGQPVLFLNNDPDLHNVNVKDSKTREQAFNVAILSGHSYEHRFNEDGLYAVNCDIHPAMAALVVATSSPYATVADSDGNFVFNSVPPGSYTLTIYAGKDAIERAITVTSPRTDIALPAR